MKRQRLLIAACLAASIGFDAGLVCAQTAAPSATTRPVADWSSVLISPAAAPARREEAARQLLREHSAASLQFLLRGLEESSDPQRQLAIARAIAGSVNPDPVFLVPLRLMMGTDRSLTEAACQAIANYKDNLEALRLLINFASSRQQRESDRLMAVRAVSAFAEKTAAEFLISLLSRDDDNQRVRNAAADSLIQMIGHFENGRDTRLWQSWWTSASKQSDAQWKSDITSHQAARFAQIRMQYEQLTSELQNVLTRTYELTPEGQQPAVMLTYLRSNQSDLRRTGALIVHNEAMAARPIPPEAREQLRTMISDSSRDVRLAVANAMLAINDPAALDSLLSQLDREMDPEVRAALAAPIASIGDLRAVAPLRKLLKDPSISAAAAAAGALRELGPVIREKDAKLAREVAVDLRAALDATGDGPGAVAFREALAEAMVPLREPELVPTLYRLLREPGSVRIRWAALRALGELRDPKSADTIARYLEDRESGVRLEAVRALKKTSAPEHAEELYRRMNPVEETDVSVRDEAWNVLQTTFAKLPLEQLPAWATRFAAEPARRLVVLRAMADRQALPGAEAALAATRQQIGVALIELNQPADAAAQFKLALDYFSSIGSQDMVVEQLVDQYLQALLRGRSFADAATFGSQLLTARAAYQQTVGVLFRNEARRLADAQGYSDCLSLIDAARKIAPPLAQRYLDEMAVIEREARAGAATRPADK